MYEKAGGVSSAFLLAILGDVRYNAEGKGDDGGGIPQKNPMLVQIYSDVLNRDVSICPTTQVGAFGAAILGVAAAPSEVTGYVDLRDAIEKLGKRSSKVVSPIKENVKAYDELFKEYKILHEYFGKGANGVMKRLNKMREKKD